MDLYAIIIFPCQVSLENLLDFLVLCERSGFIEFKLPLGGLRANVCFFLLISRLNPL